MSSPVIISFGEQHGWKGRAPADLTDTQLGKIASIHIRSHRLRDAIDAECIKRGQPISQPDPPTSARRRRRTQPLPALTDAMHARTPRALYRLGHHVAISLYGVLAMYTNLRDCHEFTYAELENEIEVSRPTLLKAIGFLENHGYLKVQRHPGEMHEYHLLNPIKNFGGVDAGTRPKKMVGSAVDPTQNFGGVRAGSAGNNSPGGAAKPGRSNRGETKTEKAPGASSGPRPTPTESAPAAPSAPAARLTLPSGAPSFEGAGTPTTGRLLSDRLRAMWSGSRSTSDTLAQPDDASDDQMFRLTEKFGVDLTPTEQKFMDTQRHYRTRSKKRRYSWSEDEHHMMRSIYLERVYLPAARTASHPGARDTSR